VLRVGFELFADVAERVGLLTAGRLWMIMTCVRYAAAAPGCASCAARDEEIALLRDQVDVLRAQQRELQDKIARLERVLSRNSGELLDAAGPVMTSREEAAAVPQGRPGRQAAARQAAGARRSVPVLERRSRSHGPAFPAGPVRTAARTLPGLRTWAVTAAHQVTDIPQMLAETTQHDVHTVRCRCGRVHTAPAP